MRNNNFDVGRLTLEVSECGKSFSLWYTELPEDGGDKHLLIDASMLDRSGEFTLMYKTKEEDIVYPTTLKKAESYDSRGERYTVTRVDKVD